jgi:hypothetical protein
MAHKLLNHSWRKVGPQSTGASTIVRWAAVATMPPHHPSSHLWNRSTSAFYHEPLGRGTCRSSSPAADRRHMAPPQPEQHRDAHVSRGTSAAQTHTVYPLGQTGGNQARLKRSCDCVFTFRTPQPSQVDTSHSWGQTVRSRDRRPRHRRLRAQLGNHSVMVELCRIPKHAGS